MAALTSTAVGPALNLLDCRAMRLLDHRLVKLLKVERKQPRSSRLLFVRYSLYLLLHKHHPVLGRP